MGYDTVIWDFNGTLLDDVAVCIDTVNTLLRHRGLKTLESPDEYRSHFCFPVIEYYRSIGFDFTKETFEAIAVEWTAENRARMKRDAHLTPGAEETLADVRAMGLGQVVLSSTEQSALVSQLEHYGISSYFDRVIGLDNIYAGGKTEAGRKALGGKAGRAVLVGDTLHDLEAARAIGCDCILYSGGHGDKSRLIETGCPVIDSLSELPEKLR